MKKIYNYLKVKLCYRTYWKQWLVFFVICFLVFACDSKSNLNVDNAIEQTFSNYVEYWSEGDFDKIVNEIYGVPFVLYTEESTFVMNTEKEVKAFLISAFKTLDSNNYGYSIRNKWEHFKSDKNLSIIEMNFTRYLKDGSIMGEKEREASYILKIIDGGYKIVALIPHTPISE